MLRTLFKNGNPTSVPDLAPFVDGANTFLREYEQLLRGLVEFIEPIEDRTTSAFKDYDLLRGDLERAASAYEALLRDLKRDLSFFRLPVISDIPRRRMGPSGEVVYSPGSSFSVYQDLAALVASAKKEVFLLDAYADEEVFELFLAKVPRTVGIRVLTAKPQGRFNVVGAKFVAEPGRTALVRLGKLHDRTVFIDDECFVLGQSLKDAAATKPTYLFRFSDAAAAWRRESETLWASSADCPLV